MALADAVQGARYVAQQITWSDGDGNAVDLTGATLTGWISDENGRSVEVDGDLTVTTPASGIFTWAYGATDVGQAGEFLVQFRAVYGGGLADKTLIQSWTVAPAIDG